MKNKTIHINETELIGMVKECVGKVMEGVATNQPYFASYDDFEAFLDETDGTMEYYYVSKEKSGLPVDIYVDDCSSYKRHNHPLWMYFCDGYSHNDKLIPISISANPTIVINDCDIDVPSVIFTSIRFFIQRNYRLLIDIADKRIDSVEFAKRLVKSNIHLSAAPSVVNEMASIESRYSNLGFDIFIDAGPRITHHNEYRLKYPINKAAEQGGNSHNYVPMSICDNPEFLPPNDVDKFNAIADMKRKRIMQKFIKDHVIELQQVSDGILDLNAYKLQLQKKTHPAKPIIGKTRRRGKRKP